MAPKKAAGRRQADKSAATAATTSKTEEPKVDEEQKVETQEAAAEEPAIASDPTQEKQEDSEAPKTEATTSKANTSKKRKGDDIDGQSAKASRRSVRGAGKAQPSQQQLLDYLLSDAAADLCRPEDERESLEKDGKDIRTYSNTALNPFEELLCAVVLSRPISHRLGLRTIRTILNPPYNFTSPKAIKDIGDEKRLQAFYDARTQHKDKTAAQVGLIAEVIGSKFGKDAKDTSLDKVRSEAKKDWDEERNLLQTNIKGLGKTGLDIFFRRVQWLWPEAYPFVDERTARGIEKLGLPKRPDDLVKALNDSWSKLDTSGLVGSDKEAKKRRAFVVICERATGADLEGKSEALLEAAAASA